mgnify:CR=1 FL=1
MDIVLIGAGNMSVAYAKAFQAAHLEFRCFGRGEASARNFEQQTMVPAGTGPLEDQLAATSIDGAKVIVAVNVGELSDVCHRLLDAGAAMILVEKPGGVDLDDMRTLATADVENRIRLAYNRRFLKSTQKAADIIAEDGGVQTIHFEFTELPDRIEALGVHPPEVLANFAYANSSHVFDMAFYLGLSADDLSDVTVSGAVRQGEISWHPEGSRFASCGTIGNNALYSCFADWRSGGNWSVEITTAHRRLRLKPLETLTQQLRETFAIEEIPLERDQTGLKPGLPDMVRNFLYDDGSKMPTMQQQVKRMQVFARILARPV